MIENRETAELIRNKLLKFRTEMHDVYRIVEETSTADELAAFSRALSRILYHHKGDILEHIYSRHPDLRPPDGD